MFVIEDEIHAEPQGEFPDKNAALAELKRRAALPWDQEPNAAPCSSWRTCGRKYELIQYDVTQSPWQELNRVTVLEISASGIKWASGFEDDASATLKPTGA